MSLAPPHDRLLNLMLPLDVKVGWSGDINKHVACSAT